MSVHVRASLTAQAMGWCCDKRARITGASLPPPGSRGQPFGRRYHRRPVWGSVSFLVEPANGPDQQSPLARHHLHPVAILPQALTHSERDEHMLLDEVSIRVMGKPELGRQFAHVLQGPHHAYLLF